MRPREDTDRWNGATIECRFDDGGDRAGGVAHYVRTWNFTTGIDGCLAQLRHEHR